MNNVLAYPVIVAALMVAAGSGLAALLDQRPRLPHLLGLAVVEAALLVYAVAALGKIFTGDRPEALATFVGYLLTAVLLPVVGWLFGWPEKTRWGSVVIAVTCLIVPILVLRLQQVWGVW